MSIDLPLSLGPDLIRFMTSGLSINAGSGGPDGLPSQCRALGCRVDAGGQVAIFLAAPQAADLLRDVRRSGRVAVVFSDPATHRTLQLKGRDAQVQPPAAGDLKAMSAHAAAFAQCLLPMGFSGPLVHALLHCREEDLVIVAFTPEAVFNQTPGAQPDAPLTAGA